MTRIYGLAALTAREKEVIQCLIGKCWRSHEVAALLGIAPKTVETHIGTIHRKCQTHNLLELARWAHLNGLVDWKNGKNGEVDAPAIIKS